ncbi:MAG: CBS domain-containing protein [Flavobacterium sp.]|nr:CBS domain-containing protein [Flavobacterium sp.]
MTILSDYINNDFKALTTKETVDEVKDFFDDVTFSHFPVLENDIYIGSISKDDLETFDLNKNLSDYKYSLERFFTRENSILLEVLEVFSKNNSNLIPVLNDENKYLGYYEIEEIIKTFQATPFLSESGNIIIVKKAIIDYSMSQISQIVESNNGKILGIYVSNSDLLNIEITVKINVGDINDIIQSFRRYDYEIISEHQQDDYISILKENANYLEKYLSI